MLRKQSLQFIKLTNRAPIYARSYCASTTNNKQDIDLKSKESSLEPGSATMKPRKWTEEQLENIHITHEPPKGFVDHLALWTIKTMRFNFDIISGYSLFKQTESTWLNRIIFLEVRKRIQFFIEYLLTISLDSCRCTRKYWWHIKTFSFFKKNEKRSWLDKNIIR